MPFICKPLSLPLVASLYLYVELIYSKVNFLIMFVELFKEREKIVKIKHDFYVEIKTGKF